ncbi:19809_t:CDS:2, partial [Cetraspora pellucida]
MNNPNLNNEATNVHHKIAICSTDRWFGNVIARSLILDSGKRSSITVRCLAQDVNNKHIKKLERLGGEIHKIDYDRPETIREALHGVCYLIFISEADKNRVKEAKIMADSAANKDVDNVIILSMEGAEDGDGKILHDFKEIERELVDLIIILLPRNSFLQQAFFLWSPNIEDRGEINMTPRESNEWAPLNIDDLICAIECLMMADGKVVTELSKKHRGKTYCLTGPELISGRKIADTINRVIEEKGDVDYHTCLADFFRNTQQSLENGKSNFIEGVNRLISATTLFEEVDRQTSCRNQYGNQYAPNRNALALQDRITGQSRFKDVQEERFNRNIAAFVNTMRDIIARLKNIDIERFELDAQERLFILSNIKDAVEVIENVQRSLDVVPFLLDERRRRDRHPRPFLPLSKYEIELILDVLDYVKEGKADRVSDDYKRITGKKPTRIKSFFEDNAESFRPGRNHRLRSCDSDDNTLIMGRPTKEAPPYSTTPTTERTTDTKKQDAYITS